MASAPKQLETKWTPGPTPDGWQLESEDEPYIMWSAVLSGTDVVALVTATDPGDARLIDERCRLIAAAPEMAKLIADIEESLTADGTYRLLREACQQMLAKIGGAS